MSAWKKHKEEHSKLNKLMAGAFGSECWYCKDEADGGKSAKRYLVTMGSSQRDSKAIWKKMNK